MVAPDEEIVQQQQDGILILRIKGATISVVIALENTVLAAIRLGQRKVVIDLRDIGSIDPIFTSSLIKLYDTMSAAGGVLRFANTPLALSHALLFSGLQQRYSIFDTVEDVLRSFT